MMIVSRLLLSILIFSASFSDSDNTLQKDIYSIIKEVYFDRGQNLTFNIEVLDFENDSEITYSHINKMSQFNDSPKINGLIIEQLSKNPVTKIEFWSKDELEKVGISKFNGNEKDTIGFHYPVFTDDYNYAAIIYEESYSYDREVFGESYCYILKKNTKSVSWEIIARYLIYEYTS